MGACMAPAAADTIRQHFEDFGTAPNDYDKIVTGDLGKVGQRVLLDLLQTSGIDLGERHMDCGIEIYDCKKQDTHAGGSGCGCSASVLSAFLLKQLSEKKWKRILFVPTGALLSKTSYNEGQSVHSIVGRVRRSDCFQQERVGDAWDALPLVVARFGKQRTGGNE